MMVLLSFVAGGETAFYLAKAEVEEVSVTASVALTLANWATTFPISELTACVL